MPGGQFLSLRVASSIDPASSFEQGTNLGPERRNTVSHDIPHQLEVNAEIVVDQPMAHAGHRSPFDA
jgi:hypothetical protein